MTIERMRHVTVLAPEGRRCEVVAWLYGWREMQVTPFRDTPETWGSCFRTTGEDTSRIELEISRLQAITAFLREHGTHRGDFLSSLFPVKTLASAADIKGALELVHSEELYESCQELRAEMDAAADTRTRLIAERERLREFAFLSVEVDRIRRLRHVAVRFVSAGRAAQVFVNDDRVREHLAAQPVRSARGGTTYVIAASAGQAEVTGQIIADYGLRELPLPEIDGTVSQREESIESELAQTARKEKELFESAAELAEELTACELALAHWESERARAAEQAMMVCSQNVFAARGYVRVSRLELLRKELEGLFPGATIVESEAPAGEEPPVSLSWSRFVRPAGLLVKMFGLPKYGTFDPTPFVMATFLTFFGICFGDLLYGAMLIAVAGLLKRRFAGQKNLVEFFRLFTYAGVTTMIFGVLTGSWGSDLTAYFGEGNALDSLRQRLTLLDPLQQPMTALGIAVGIGIANQFYGLVLKFLSCAWRGDYLGGLFDGGLWFVYLASLIVMSIGMAGIAGEAMVLPSLCVFVASAIGLVLTQGRAEKGFAGKAITGVVSLYGILGGYGTTSFIGDVLSYSRLLALGLTTTVIGMAFNIIAGFLKQMPFVGLALFVLVACFGHTFNFVMSILGSFVHPARLIFLEFFGRFYESGGAAFRPFGFRSANVELVEGK